MNIFEKQKIIFTKIPRRLEVSALDTPPERKNRRHISVNVWRNHSIEPVLSLISPYSDFGGWVGEFHLSDYDDAFLFTGYARREVELFWVDRGRYKINQAPEDWIAWLTRRLVHLRRLSKAPIILLTWSKSDCDQKAIQSALDDIVHCYFADLRVLALEYGIPLFDVRTAKISGTPLNPKMHVLIARELAGKWIPGCALPPIKAVAVDLDNTLHRGVLGEDGIGGVVVSEEHTALQELLVALKDRGVFICLVSKNEASDVRDLFSSRLDYLLKWNDFSAAEVSWSEKSDALSRISAKLNIAFDSILFIDDNIGEIYSVRNRMPDMKLILADPDAELTRMALEYYPGLWRWDVVADDRLRIEDQQANEERRLLADQIDDLEEYYNSLEVTLTVRTNQADQIDRIADLCMKTNQFNLNLSRYGRQEVADHMMSDSCEVVTVALKDRLSDSGVIAVVFLSNDGLNMSVEELCISCRALGRRLESAIVMGAITATKSYSNCESLFFRYTVGPRNGPARDWLFSLPGLDFGFDNGVAMLSVEQFNKLPKHSGLSFE